VKKIHVQLKAAILKMVDFFYPPFKKMMPLQTFRYAACGGSNTLLNIVIFFISYNFIFAKHIFYFQSFAISPHIAAYITAFLITFPTGFYLSLFVVFPESHLRKRVQLFRYFLVVIVCIFLNYFLLKLFVDQFGWYPTLSQILITVLIIAFSYFSQRHFSFRKKNNLND
jgi:putative flippase GtrA